MKDRSVPVLTICVHPPVNFVPYIGINERWEDTFDVDDLIIGFLLSSGALAVIIPVIAFVDRIP